MTDFQDTDSGKAHYLGDGCSDGHVDEATIEDVIALVAQHTCGWDERSLKVWDRLCKEARLGARVRAMHPGYCLRTDLDGNSDEQIFEVFNHAHSAFGWFDTPEEALAKAGL